MSKFFSDFSNNNQNSSSIETSQNIEEVNSCESKKEDDDSNFTDKDKSISKLEVNSNFSSHKLLSKKASFSIKEENLHSARLSKMNSKQIKDRYAIDSNIFEGMLNFILNYSKQVNHV